MRMGRLGTFLSSDRARTWRRRLTRLAETGTAGYPEPVRRNVAGALRVDVVLGHGRDAAPIVDPGRDHFSESAGFKLGGAWMFMSGPKTSRATAMVQR